MKYQYSIVGLIVFCFLSPQAFGATEKKEEQGVLVNGVFLNIAKDRKIEKVGGIYEPEGLDKYVERRINLLDDRLQKMEEQMQETNRKLDKLSLQIASGQTDASTASLKK